MKRGRLPLTGLRSFEAAGRHQSFTSAAEELFISQAAVSRQVRDLEHLVGQPLFTRLHRKVALTAAGERLLAVLTKTFDEMDDALRIARTATPVSLRISVEPSFAGCWLVNHLSAFQEAFPGIDVIVESEPRLIDFRRDQPQIAIRHTEGSGEWPRSESCHLFDVRMIAVISPRLRKAGQEIRNPADLSGRALLHEDNHDVWERWFKAAGVSVDAPSRGAVYADGGLVQQAVIGGHGIGLVDKVFARDDLSAGRLERLFNHTIPYGSYYIVARRFDVLSEPAKVFVEWLLATFSGRRDASS